VFAAVTAIVGLAATFTACELFFPTQIRDTGDATAPGSEASSREAGTGKRETGTKSDTSTPDDTGSDTSVAAEDFSVQVSPNYVSLAANGNTNVTVSINRSHGFTGLVSAEFTALQHGVSAAPGSAEIGDAGVSFQLLAPSTLAPSTLGDYKVTVTGTAGSGPQQQQASTTLTVHLTGFLASFGVPAMSGPIPFVVPSNVTLLRMKAWGAGGAAGMFQGGSPTGGGGGGGCVIADVRVTPNETLGVVVGRAGGGGEFRAGGGYSAVLRGPRDAGAPQPSVLIIAGGGGTGGSSGGEFNEPGGSGGAGGGLKGQNGFVGAMYFNDGCPGGSGGGGATQTMPGVSYGMKVFSGGGLGGGGLYDGGIGGLSTGTSCTSGGPGGGGGGSGGVGVQDAGIDVISNTPGSGATPANQADPNYVDAAGAGAPPCGQGSCGAANPGLVVFLVP
jgi:hypothetical protein